MRAHLHTLFTGVVASAIVASPKLAWACSVCSAGREDETRTAFILTTAFLTVLPLAMIGGLIYCLVRRARQLERDADRPRAHARPVQASLSGVSRASSSP